jgi:PPE-repeat protein
MSDYIQATPRNALLGLLADGLKSGSDFLTQNSLPDGVRPYNIPSAKGLLDMLNIPAVANTLKEMSYGGALGTGSGMTWKPKSDTVDAALAVSPLLAKAPKVANAGLGLLGDTMAANAVRQPNMSQAGAILFPPMTRAEQSVAVKKYADDFADIARGKGLSASVEHSGSSFGPSSYVQISDPITGRRYVDPFRFSNHSKGAFNHQFVTDVTGNYGDVNLIERELKLLDKLVNEIPKSERDALQFAQTSNYLRNLYLQNQERPYSTARKIVNDATKEARDLNIDYTKVFSNSGKYIGSSQ